MRRTYALFTRYFHRNSPLSLWRDSSGRLQSTPIETEVKYEDDLHEHFRRIDRFLQKSTKSQINSITRQTEDLSTHDSMSFVHDSEYTRTEYTRAIDVNGRGWTTGDETEEGSRVKYLKS